MLNLSILRRLISCTLCLCAVAGAQGQFTERNPAVFLSQANWVRQLTATQPTKIIVDPAQPNSPLFMYEDRDTQSPRHGIKLCWLRLPKSLTSMAVTDVNRSGMSSAIYESLKKDSDIVVMNGGFFGFGRKNDFVPLGLVIAGGRQSSAIMNWTTGGLVLQSGGIPTVLPVGEFGSLTGIEHAIQSKPMLVEKGKIGINSDPNPPFNRSAVAVDKSGDLIVAGAFDDDGDAVTLIEFSQFLATLTSEGGPAAYYALNLDGGPDAHFYFPKIGLHLGYGGQNYVPDAIHFSVK